MTAPDQPEDRTIEVQNVPAAWQKQIQAWKEDDPHWREWFAVYVGQAPKPGQPAMLGSFEPLKTGFRFVPRFPLEPGTTYCAKLNLPGQKSQLETFALPADKPEHPTTIAAVYPTAQKLPENLLRIYIHFSAPMSRGRSYRHLHLVDQTGEEVQNPFLELPQELWSADRTRLTVLLDPGRVKQGLKPREQSGPVLEPGHRYTFTIDEDWHDAKGFPLDKSFKRTFLTTKADITQPNPAEWKIAPPKAGTREPVSVTFDEPLDHAMLEHVLSLVGADSAEVAGGIEIDQHETRWRFTPKEPWKAGRYSLKIQTSLEDRVGNSIARPFEVDLNEPQPAEVPKVLLRGFEIKN